MTQKKTTQRKPETSRVPHGLPVVIETPDGKDVERAMFASVRACPEVGVALAKASKLFEERTALAESTAALFDITPTGDDSVASEMTAEQVAALGKATDDLNAVTARLYAAIGEFYRAGLRGAGYSEEDVERLVVSFDPDRFQELRLRAIAGCGKMDFNLTAT